MKRIVLCFDGTWNKPADEDLPIDRQIETNVSRFHKSVLSMGADGARQVTWYDQGIGTHWFDRFTGGTIGAGLEFNIMEGYKFLAKEYQDGDEVYVLGFSRGAYTARSLVGLIRNCGLIEHTFVPLKLAIAYGIYRTRDDAADSLTAQLFRAKFSRDIRIKCIGVWDTVGALGIPLDILESFNMQFYEFHDTQLSDIVDHAYHALAVDEQRKNYDVCLWNPPEQLQQTIEQRWFIGAHSDVGGGYAERHLSDLTLRWMQEKVSALGLELTPVVIAPDNYRAPYTDSYAAFLRGRYAALHARYRRAIGTTPFGNEVIDDSVQTRRREDPHYAPTNAGLPTLD